MDPLSQSITDNFWNKFTFNLKVIKYEVINQIPLVTVTMSEKQDVKAVVQDSFQGMTNQVWGALDFSNPSVSQEYNYYNSQNGLTPFIYGPLKVGSSSYYVAQTQEKDSAGVSSVKVYVKGGRFDWKDADNYILGPEEMKKSTVLIPTGGKTMVGSAMSVLLPGSLSEIYFVPLDFDFDITTAYPKGETKFFVGGETAFKQQFPTATANVYTSTTGSLSTGTDLPNQQVPGDVVTPPTAGSGECVGKTTGAIVEHVPTGPAPAVSIKQYLAERLKSRWLFEKLAFTQVRLGIQGIQTETTILENSIFKMHWPEVLKMLDEMKIADSSYQKFQNHNEHCQPCKILESNSAGRYIKSPNNVLDLFQMTA